MSVASAIQEDVAFVVVLTALTLLAPFVFAWAGNPSTWQRKKAGALGADTLGDPALAKLAILFLVAVLLQSVHMSEHIAQLIQKYPLGQAEAHGLLGSILDREWVHLSYNVAYFLLLALLLLGYRSALRGSRATHLSLFFTLIWFAYLLQGFHVAEHSLKVVQHLRTGMEDTPGLAGQLFPLIWVHFTYNLLVYVPAVLAFFGAGVYKALLNPASQRSQAAKKPTNKL